MPHRHLDAITPEIAATTLYYYDIETNAKIEPGDWRRRLLALIAKSDEIHRARLRTVYAGEVAACEVAEHGPVEDLIRIASDWGRS